MSFILISLLINKCPCVWPQSLLPLSHFCDYYLTQWNILIAMHNEHMSSKVIIMYFACIHLLLLSACWFRSANSIMTVYSHELCPLLLDHWDFQFSGHCHCLLDWFVTATYSDSSYSQLASICLLDQMYVFSAHSIMVMIVHCYCWTKAVSLLSMVSLHLCICRRHACTHFVLWYIASVSHDLWLAGTGLLHFAFLQMKIDWKHTFLVNILLAVHSICLCYIHVYTYTLNLW